jgi:hypothetical protein
LLIGSSAKGYIFFEFSEVDGVDATMVFVNPAIDVSYQLTQSKRERFFFKVQ